MQVETRQIDIKQISPNRGQVPGLPKNPRFIKDASFDRMVKSIQDNPEMLYLRELLVYPYDGKFVIIGGEMRFRAMKHLDFKECPCKIIPKETSPAQLRAYVLKDNSSFGEWDVEELKEYDDTLLVDCEIEVPEIRETETTAISEEEEEQEEQQSEDDMEKESFYRSMYSDCLYESNNIFEIPNLLKEMQAGKLELPFTPWGANSRLKKDVTTYHFYVDDYRFEALFKNPINLLMSGCKAVVEPNCSLHDQTPIAWGLQLIYKKRWISRYFQECGIKVYADLNVSHKFIEYNKMGIPKGYNAFFTRGTDGWLESLKSDLEVAQEISGLEVPNLCVYGGGQKVKEFCMEHSLLYVTDFINAKKI
jgi:hypothetical protein